MGNYIYPRPVRIISFTLYFEVLTILFLSIRDICIEYLNNKRDVKLHLYRISVN